MFIKVLEVEGNQEVRLNTEHICYIHEKSNSVLVDGVHSLGHGFLHLDDESMKRVLNNIENVDLKNSDENVEKSEIKKEIRLEDIELIFRKTYDIDKFIDEYREFILWIEKKYTSFKDEIKKDYWIQRIIREHDEILVELRNNIKSGIGEPNYLVNNREKVNEIYERNMEE